MTLQGSNTPHKRSDNKIYRREIKANNDNKSDYSLIKAFQFLKLVRNILFFNLSILIRLEMDYILL